MDYETAVNKLNAKYPDIIGKKIECVFNIVNRDTGKLICTRVGWLTPGWFYERRETDFYPAPDIAPVEK